MLLRLSVQSLFFTVWALYRFIIGVSSKNFVIATEFTSQSQYLGVRMAESFSTIPKNIFWKITFISVSGVFGISLVLIDH